MKELLVFIAAVFLLSCSDDKKEVAGKKDTKLSLRTDTLNVVKLTDTLVIYESTCRGCAYEGSTHFAISDSAGIVKLETIITTDNNPSDMDGGSISKTLLLVPVKTGLTTIKMYKFLEQTATVKDSARFTAYTIEVQN